jgi:hypothetical protein
MGRGSIVGSVLGLCSACGAAAPDGRFGTGSPGLDESSSDFGSDDDADDDVLDVGDLARLDLGGASEDPGWSVGCAGIDFLFVIDDSSSMAAQQERLVSSFAGFIAAIEASLTDVTSYHVGVITSDAYQYNTVGCEELGALVDRTGGDDSANRACGPFAHGNRFATEADDLLEVFPCIASVGTSGAGEELPLSAAAAALSPEMLAPGACNEGFIREEAILVVVVVTDDPPSELDHDDAHPSSYTTAWYEAVVAAKGGNGRGAVVIGFVPYEDLSCLVYAKDSPNLIDFVESFDHGVLASVCADDYAATFASTIATIETSCDEYTPAG